MPEPVVRPPPKDAAQIAGVFALPNAPLEHDQSGTSPKGHEGFESGGTVYRSLTAAAKVITGTHWKWVGGSPILGYDLDPAGGRLLVNENEAQTVRRIFDVYLQRQSLLDTVRELNRQGITTKRWTTRKGVQRGGGPRDKAKLAYTLGNWTFAGKVRRC